MNARLESPPARFTTDETEDFTPAPTRPLITDFSQSFKCSTQDSTVSAHLPPLTLASGGNVWNAFDASASRRQMSGYRLPDLEIDCSPKQLFTAFDAPVSTITAGDGIPKQGAPVRDKLTAKEEAERAGQALSKLLEDIFKNGVPGAKPKGKQDPVEKTAPGLIRPDLKQPAAGDGVEVSRQFPSRSTSYYPANTRMQGGHWDRKGYELFTLQQYLRGEAPYVSVAMDSKVARYGTQIRIPELEEKYGRPIDFRLVDTGGRFKGRGTHRIDICSETKRDAYRPEVNKTFTVEFVKRDGAPDIYDIPRRHRGRR